MARIRTSTFWKPFQVCWLSHYCVHSILRESIKQILLGCATIKIKQIAEGSWVPRWRDASEVPLMKTPQEWRPKMFCFYSLIVRILWWKRKTVFFGWVSTTTLDLENRFCLSKARLAPSCFGGKKPLTLSKAKSSDINRDRCGKYERRKINVALDEQLFY